MPHDSKLELPLDSTDLGKGTHISALVLASEVTAKSGRLEWNVWSLARFPSGQGIGDSCAGFSSRRCFPTFRRSQKYQKLQAIVIIIAFFILQTILF